MDRMTMMSEDDNKNNGSRGNNQSICIDFLPLVLLLFLPPFRMLMVIVDAPIILLLFIHLQHPRTVPDSSLCRPPANHQSNSPQTTMDTTYRHPFIRPVCDPNPRVVLALSHYHPTPVVLCCVYVGCCCYRRPSKCPAHR